MWCKSTSTPFSIIFEPFDIKADIQDLEILGNLVIGHCEISGEPGEREALRLASSHVIAVNVKSKPFDIFHPCWKISLFEIGVGQTQYLYYVMHTSYYQNSPRDLELNYLIFELCTLKWTINPSANMRAFWFQYNFMSIPLPPRPVGTITVLLGNFPQKLPSEIPKT